MSQIARYYNNSTRREYQYSKRNNIGNVYSLVRKTEIKHGIKATLRNLTRENNGMNQASYLENSSSSAFYAHSLVHTNNVPIKPCIMIEKGDLSITMSLPDPTTRKMLGCMKENDFKGIMEYINTIDQTDYSAIVDFCKCLETTIGIMRLVADNSMQKVTLEDYQRGLFDIMQAARALADNPKSASRRRDLEKWINTLLRRLESHAALTEILKECGETEEDLDKRMSASVLKF